MLNRLQAVFASFHARDLIEASPDNARRLLDAMIEAQMGTAALVTPEELLANEITVFNGRVRVDVPTSTPGLNFESAWRRRVTMHYQGQVFYVVSREDLIASKRAAGRRVDLEDVCILEQSGPEPPR